MADLTSLPSKIVRAFRFYLISVGAVDAAHCYHKYDSRTRVFNDQPIVTVNLLPIGPEEQYSGNDLFIVQLQTAFQAAEQPDDLADQPRLAFDAQVGKVRQAIMQSDDGGQTLNVIRNAINAAAYTMSTAPDATSAGQRFAAINADMDDFTLLSLYQDIYGNAVDKSNEGIWIIEQRFKVSACESKIAGYA
jgi:hypothetical protein